MRKIIVSEQRIKESFGDVHQDIDALKGTIIEWITTLVDTQKRMLEKIKELEQRVEKMEKQ